MILIGGVVAYYATGIPPESKGNREETMKLAHCIECGCHDFAACHDDQTGGPCSWLAVDRQAGQGVCSSCSDALERWKAGNGKFAVPLGADAQAVADLYGEPVFQLPPGPRIDGA